MMRIWEETSGRTADRAISLPVLSDYPYDPFSSPVPLKSPMSRVVISLSASFGRFGQTVTSFKYGHQQTSDRISPFNVYLVFRSEKRARLTQNRVIGN